MSVEPGNIFRIRVNRNIGSAPFPLLGYVQFKQVEDLVHKEWVCAVGSTDPNQAANFQYFPQGSAIIRSYEQIKALVPGSSPSTDLTPKSGDYLVFWGQGGEWNPLLFGTTEYRNSITWRFVDLNGNNVDTPQYNTPYKIVGFTVSICPILNQVTSAISGGAHGRTIQPGQLRFGLLGSAAGVNFELELV